MMKKRFRVLLLSVCVAMSFAGAYANDIKTGKKTKTDSIPLNNTSVIF